MPAIAPATFQRLLLAWFDKHGRKTLPWQQNKSPYRVWVSEIMLQQTQVATVIPYFQRFMQRFPDCETLAKAHEDTVLHHWAGLGYYSRARNLHKTAQQVMEKFAGLLPDQFELLTSLPGIGPSTANAILSIAFNQQAAILDGNVKRVLARVFAIEAPININTTEATLWAIAQRYMPAKRAADYTQAMMDLGATLCTRSKPQCTACPLRKHCLAYQQNKVDELPIKKAARALPIRAATFLIHQKGDNVLLIKRPARGIWGSLWCFPELAHAPDTKALKKLGITDFEIIAAFRHTFTHYHLDIHPLLIKTRRLPTHLSPETTYTWQSLTQAVALGLPKPVQTLLQQLRKAGKKSKTLL